MVRGAWNVVLREIGSTIAIAGVRDRSEVL